MNPMTVASRAQVRSIVRSVVFQAFRQDQRVLSIRRYHFVSVFRTTWQSHLYRVRDMSIARVSSWLPSWIPAWRQQAPAPVGQDGPSSGGDGDPRHISVPQLAKMLASSRDFVVHGTSKEDVGRCQVPVRAETDQSRMSNPMQPVGVYGFRGLTAAIEAGYGPYAVVFRYSDGAWQQFEAAVIHRGDGSLLDGQVVGWFHKDDLAAARRLPPG
jgi:hypothetical protein